MKIVKRKELFLAHDVYIFEEVGPYFLSNKGEQGIVLITQELATVTEIMCPKNVYIYGVLRRADNNAVLLYCPEERCFVFNDLQDKASFIIPLQQVQGIISPFYTWDTDTLFFATYDNTFYKCLVNKALITEISETEFTSANRRVSALRKKIGNDTEVYSCDPYSLECVVREGDEAFVYNAISFVKTNIPKIFFNMHDVVFQDELWCFVSEDELLFKNRESEVFLSQEDKSNYFLRFRLKHHAMRWYAYVLEANKHDSSTSVITLYEIVHD